MRVREVLALLQHPSVPQDAVVESNGKLTVDQLLRMFLGAEEDTLDAPMLVKGGMEVTAVYVGDRQLRMSDPL